MTARLSHRVGQPRGHIDRAYRGSDPVEIAPWWSAFFRDLVYDDARLTGASWSNVPPGPAAIPFPFAKTGAEMKRNVFLLLLVLIGVPQSLFSNTLYFPHAVFGGGYSTTFVITNTGTANVASTVTFFGQDGNIRPDLNVPINLAAGSSTRITLPNSGPVTIVWAQVAAGAGTVQGVATFDFRASGGGLITTAGVLGIEAGSSFLLPVDVSASPRTDTGF